MCIKVPKKDLQKLNLLTETFKAIRIFKFIASSVNCNEWLLVAVVLTSNRLWAVVGQLCLINRYLLNKEKALIYWPAPAGSIFPFFMGHLRSHFDTNSFSNWAFWHLVLCFNLGILSNQKTKQNRTVLRTNRVTFLWSLTALRSKS